MFLLSGVFPTGRISRRVGRMMFRRGDSLFARLFKLRANINWYSIGRFLLAVFILEHLIVMLRVRSIQSTAPVSTVFDAPTVKSDLEIVKLVTCANCSSSPNDPLIVYYKDKPADPFATKENYYNKRPTKVSEFTYGYLQKPSSPCSDATFMTVLVHSKTSYYKTRETIRQTWGSGLATSTWPNHDTPLPPIKLVFMLGADSDPLWNSYAGLESRVHNDIVQGDFQDSYINMTLKSLLGLRWVYEECPKARYMLKIDDDMVVNFPRLVSLLQAAPFTRSILGPLNPGSTVERGGLWGVPENVFPFPTWPMYASGAAYVISADIVKELYTTAEYIPHIHVDDAYITGILAKIIGAQHRNEAGFAYWGSPKPKPCDFIKNKIYTGTKIQTHEDKVWFWQSLSNPSVISSC